MNKEEWEAALTDSQRVTLARWRDMDPSELEDGEYPDPDSANSYRWALHGRFEPTPCAVQPDGTRLVFDPKIKVCRYPSDVSIDENPAYRE